MSERDRRDGVLSEMVCRGTELVRVVEIFFSVYSWGRFVPRGAHVCNPHGINCRRKMIELTFKQHDNESIY